MLVKQVRNLEPESNVQHQRDVKNKIAINGIYIHLKHNRKHKIAWDDAVYIHHKS